MEKTEEFPREPIELVATKIQFFEVVELANRWKYLSEDV